MVPGWATSTAIVGVGDPERWAGEDTEAPPAPSPAATIMGVSVCSEAGTILIWRGGGGAVATEEAKDAVPAAVVRGLA